MNLEALWTRIASQVWIDELDCWIWLGPRRRHGGGHRPAISMRILGAPSTMGPRQHNTCRVVCEIIHGPAPEGHEASHLCEDEWLCVNPDHLLWESKTENLARRDAKKRREMEERMMLDVGVRSTVCPF